MLKGKEILKEKILKGDSNLERSMKVRQESETSILCYRVSYEEEKKKSTGKIYTNFYPRNNNCIYALHIYK
jgi:hypothetical protein